MSIGTATVVVGILIAGLLGVVAFALLRRPGQVRSTPLASTGAALLDAQHEADDVRDQARTVADELIAQATAEAERIRQRAGESTEFAQQLRAGAEAEARATRAVRPRQMQPECHLERKDGQIGVGWVSPRGEGSRGKFGH